MTDVIIPFLKNYWRLIVGSILCLISLGSMIAFIIASDNDWFGIFFVGGAIASGVVLLISILVFIVPFVRKRSEQKRATSI